MGKKKTGNLHLVLIHYPVLNKRGEIIASAITNLDIHDLARLSATYDVEFSVVTPLKEQLSLVKKIKDYWSTGFGGKTNPHRKEALSRVRYFSRLEQVIFCNATNKKKGKIVLTSAKNLCYNLKFSDARKLLHRGEDLYLLLGTAWGLAPEVERLCDYRLEPIIGIGAYNHLSVRTAAAIMVDRLKRLSA